MAFLNKAIIGLMLATPAVAFVGVLSPGTAVADECMAGMTMVSGECVPGESPTPAGTGGVAEPTTNSGGTGASACAASQPFAGADTGDHNGVGAEGLPFSGATNLTDCPTVESHISSSP